jgi:hypothetical protein
MKTYLVVYVYDNHIWDVIVKADNADEAEQKVYDKFKTNASDVERSIVKELTRQELKDTHWIDDYIQEWKNELTKQQEQ